MQFRILLLAAVLAFATGCATVKGWFGGNKAKKALEPAELTELASPLHSKTMWSVNLGDKQEKIGLRTHPVVEGDRVYVVDDSGEVRALSLSNGKPLWKQQVMETRKLGSRLLFWRKSIVETGLTSSPAAANGLVVVGGRNGEVIALDAETGKTRWQTTVSSEVIAAPLITSDRIVVRSNDGRVFGLDPADGSRKWVFDRGLPTLSVRGSSAPVAGQGVAYVGYDDGTVVMLRLEDGARGWEQVVAEPEGRAELDRMADIDGEIQVGLNDLFAISYHNQMMAISIANGQPLWNRDVGSYAGIALLADRVVVSDKDGTVWALDRSTGNALWKQDALARRMLTTPAVQGDYIVVGDLEGYVHWIRSDTGEIVARARLEHSVILATPQVSVDGTLLVQSVEGKLAAYPLPK